MNAGKWIVSTNEECFTDSSDEFDTEAEAVDYALNYFASEYGLQPGDRVYVGQIVQITRNTLATVAADASRAIEDMDAHIYELVGDEVANTLNVNRMDELDLQQRLEATILGWLNDHNINAPCFAMNSVEAHVVVRDFDAEEEQQRQLDELNA